MFRKLWILLLGIGPWSVQADYHNDQLFLALKPAVAVEIMDANGQLNKAAFLKMFSMAFDDVQVSDLRAPFFQARHTSLQNVLHIRFSQAADVKAHCAVLNRHPGVEYAEPVPVIKSFSAYIPNDLGPDNYEGQWYLHKIQAPEAWGLSKGSPDITVAVVDQAVDIEHPDLQETIWSNPGEIPNNGIDDDNNGYVDDVHGYDIAEDDADPSPDHPGQTHGTHVAGLVSAKSDNGTGIASIGFDLSIIAVKSTSGSATGATPYEGIVYAANTGADIISCSWGGYSFSITNKNVIEYAQQQGSLVVCSAGNDAQDILAYPSAYSGVVSVGATTKLDRMATFTNYNENLSVSSPGYEILSTLPGNQYQTISGTSMSAPIVSGLFGLMKSHYPEISNDELKTCLLTTTDPVNIHHNRYEGKTGTGRINAYRAMQCVDNLKNGASRIRLPEDSNILSIYPNPTRGLAYVSTPIAAATDKPAVLIVTDLSGRKISYQRYRKNPDKVLEIDTHTWSKGVYLVELRQGEETWCGKLIIK